MAFVKFVLLLAAIVPCCLNQKIQEGSQNDDSQLSDREEKLLRQSASILGWLPESGVRRIKAKPPSEVCKNEADNGKNYFDRCNWCRCVDIGEAFCTKKACPIEPATLPRIRSLPAAIMCTAENAGKSYNDGCNRCFCPSEKASDFAACTRRACPPVLPFDAIEPSTAELSCITPGNGTVYYESDCRVCVCTGLQSSWCYEQRRPGCRPPTVTKYREEERVRVVSTRRRQGGAPITALPPVSAETACLTERDEGFSFYDGCNWCTCTDVIGEALCMQRECKKRRN